MILILIKNTMDKRIYVVWANSDNTEGRGYPVVKYFCGNRTVAEGLAKGLGPMGCSDGDVTEEILIDSTNDLKEIELLRKRQRALSKLTPEEKTLLGLKDEK